MGWGAAGEGETAGPWGGGWCFGRGRQDPTSPPFHRAHWGTPEQPWTVWCPLSCLRVSAPGADGAWRCAGGGGGGHWTRGRGRRGTGVRTPWGARTSQLRGGFRETLTRVRGVSFTHSSAGLRKHLPWGLWEQNLRCPTVPLGPPSWGPLSWCGGPGLASPQQSMAKGRGLQLGQKSPQWAESKGEALGGPGLIRGALINEDLEARERLGSWP